MATVTTVAIVSVRENRKLEQKIQQERENLENQKVQELEKQKQTYEQQLKETNDKNKSLQNDLEAAKQSKAQKTLTTIASAVAPVQHAQAASDAKMFIYMHESGNRPDAVNSKGCVGLGQACPWGAKPALLAACPNWATDYACQDAFWTNVYMAKRYGSWDNAKTFWLAHSWW